LGVGDAAAGFEDDAAGGGAGFDVAVGRGVVACGAGGVTNTVETTMDGVAAAGPEAASAFLAFAPEPAPAPTVTLTIGITLVTMFTVVTSSIKASATGSIEKHYPFDFQITAERDRAVPQDAIDRLKALPELGVVAAEYDGKASVNGRQTQVGAMDQAGLGTLIKPLMKQGSITDVGPGTVAVQDNQLAGLKTAYGQTVSVTTKSGTNQTLKVVAVYTDSGVGMPELVMATRDFVQDIDSPGPVTVAILGKPGVSTAASRPAVENAVAADPLLTVGSVADYKKSLSSALDQILALFSGLLGLAVLIALIGIANTLSLSVIERTRESALLRALGLTKPQLRRGRALGSAGAGRGRC
jgi:putative ABC transport system permease protein